MSNEDYDVSGDKLSTLTLDEICLIVRERAEKATTSLIGAPNIISLVESINALITAIGYPIKFSLHKKPILKPIPSYGDLMTLGEFIDGVNSVTFTNDDGHGYYATATQMSDIKVRPSDVGHSKHPAQYTHIVWFNK